MFAHKPLRAVSLLASLWALTTSAWSAREGRKEGVATVVVVGAAVEVVVVGAAEVVVTIVVVGAVEVLTVEVEVAITVVVVALVAVAVGVDEGFLQTPKSPPPNSPILVTQVEPARHVEVVAQQLVPSGMLAQYGWLSA
jgi:hypothetical protein